MGICYGKVAAPQIPIPQPQEQENNGGATNEDDKCRIGESPSVEGISKPSPFPFYSPSPANSNFRNSPANSTPRRFFKRPFPPPSPAKHIKAALARRQGSVKPNEVAIPEGSESEEVVLDKNFGFSKNFSSKYDLGYEVGRGHFGHTCFAKSRKGELKGQSVAVKIISKAKVTTLQLYFFFRCLKLLDAFAKFCNFNSQLPSVGIHAILGFSGRCQPQVDWFREKNRTRKV